MCKGYIFLLLSLCTLTAEAKDFFPKTCHPIPVQTAALLFQSKKPLLILVYNHSRLNLWLTHPAADSNVSAGWTSQLESGHWSALVLGKGAFELNCIESRPGHEQQISCVNLVHACEWTAAILPQSSLGSFWAVENTDLANLMAQLGDKGFKFP